MTIYNFFVFCPEDGFEVFETLDDALDDANEKIKGYLDDGWSEDVTGVCAGKITHRAKMCDQVFRDGEVDEDGLDEAGDYWDPDWDFKCNYKMMPVEPGNSSDGVTKLVPTKPTAEMVSEGARYLQIMSLPEREAASVFRAMLAAAPPSEQQPEQPDVSALVKALDGAARSLETISRQAGINEYMHDFLEVRRYARNRSLAAFEAISAYRNGGE